MFEQGINLPTGERPAAAFEELPLELPALLLHSCCGPCSTAVVEQLAPRFRSALFFCNSNIDDEAEYKKRLDAQKKFVDMYNASPDRTGEPITLICAPYTPLLFLKMVEGLESCEEGGARCRLCIEDRLEKTAIYAALHGYGSFSTTLSVSRHKDHRLILEQGKALALRYGLAFVEDDFKVGGGSERAALLAKSYGLYRQNYCGCRFSKR